MSDDTPSYAQSAGVNISQRNAPVDCLHAPPAKSSRRKSCTRRCGGGKTCPRQRNGCSRRCGKRMSRLLHGSAASLDVHPLKLVEAGAGVGAATPHTRPITPWPFAPLPRALQPARRAPRWRAGGVRQSARPRCAARAPAGERQAPARCGGGGCHSRRSRCAAVDRCTRTAAWPPVDAAALQRPPRPLGAAARRAAGFARRRTCAAAAA